MSDQSSEANTHPYALEPTEPPKYLYKIIPSNAAPPYPLPVALRLSALDAKDGFIHLSTSIQVPATAGRFFGLEDILYLARIEYANVKPEIRWEVAGSSGGVFAHLYNGGRLGSGEIESVKRFERGVGMGGAKEETWEEVLQKQGEGWLVY